MMIPRIQITLSQHLIDELIWWLNQKDQKEYLIMCKGYEEIRLIKDKDVTVSIKQ